MAELENGRDAQSLMDWQCFAYLTAEKGKLYRAIVDVFAAAKTEFTLHLRPAQVCSALNEFGISIESADVESALQSLESWGNLQSYQDNADVASLADYYRKRLLYQLTAAGEAAHASTLTFAERLEQQAKLDARALDRIAEGAGQLQRLATQLRGDASAVDSVVVLAAVRNICQDADELTSRAQSFFRWLHEQTESDRGDLEAFLTYKEQLIEYLQQFVSELIASGSVIANRLNAIRQTEYSQLARLTADEEVGQPRAGEEDAHSRRIDKTKQRWLQRLLGLRGWFSRSGGRAAQLEQLRAAARAAIPRLLQLAGQMNERQSGRSDRVADLRTLAVKFLTCKSDTGAHRLYRAAFALSPARHLRVEHQTVEFRDQHPIAPSTRWQDSAAIEFASQLRNTGRQPAATANRRVVDRTEHRAAAKRRISMEAGRDSSSRETLIALGKRRLSEIGKLDRDSFRLMMELIEQAVAKPTATQTNQQDITRATSRDGSLQVNVQPVAEAENVSNRQLATISTEGGNVMLADMWIEVTHAG